MRLTDDEIRKSYTTIIISITGFDWLETWTLEEICFHWFENQKCDCSTSKRILNASQWVCLFFFLFRFCCFFFRLCLNEAFNFQIKSYTNWKRTDRLISALRGHQIDKRENCRRGRHFNESIYFPNWSKSDFISFQWRETKNININTKINSKGYQQMNRTSSIPNAQLCMIFRSFSCINRIFNRGVANGIIKNKPTKTT